MSNTVGVIVAKDSTTTSNKDAAKGAASLALITGGAYAGAKTTKALVSKYFENLKQPRIQSRAKRMVADDLRKVQAEIIKYDRYLKIVNEEVKYYGGDKHKAFSLNAIRNEICPDFKPREMMGYYDMPSYEEKLRGTLQDKIIDASSRKDALTKNRASKVATYAEEMSRKMKAITKSSTKPLVKIGAFIGGFIAANFAYLALKDA